VEKRLAAAAADGAHASQEKDLRDFVLGTVFGLVQAKPEGYVVVDPAKDRPLHRFRDRAFAAYAALHPDVKRWVVQETAKSLRELVEDRRFDELAKAFAGVRDRLETERRRADLPEEKAHYARELEALEALAGENRVRLS
jgi:hypothetical protein